MKPTPLSILLLILLMGVPSLIRAQVTQPDGIYTNFIQFKFEDPEYPVDITMKSDLGIGLDIATFSPSGLNEYVNGRKAKDRVWAIVSDSVFYLNMRRYYMGNFYIKFDSLEEFTYFKGKRIVSKDERIKRNETVFMYGLVGLGVTDAVRTIKHGQENDFFLSIEDGMVYNLTLESLLEIDANNVVKKEIEELSPENGDIDMLKYLLSRINDPDAEIERPNIQEDEQNDKVEE